MNYDLNSTKICSPKGPVNNILALVQIMAWFRSDDKPSSEQMVAELSDAYMRHSAAMSQGLFPNIWAIIR